MGTTDPEVRKLSEKYFEIYNFVMDGERGTYSFQLDNVKIDEKSENDVIVNIEEIAAMILR